VVTNVCDVTKEEENHALAILAIEKFGAINLVLPSAGIIRDGLMLSIDKEVGKVIKRMSLYQFQSVLDINLTGVFLTVRECSEQMINSGSKGLICLMSSIGSLGTAQQINYSSTKAAMSVIPKVITAEFFRRDLAHRIRCVAIAPGYVATPMVSGMNKDALNKILENVPIKRLVEPEEIASLVGELYRNEALAGEVFYVHGGLRLSSKG
jgi:3-oxoacyl-[acyl-carrier protein] reductase